MVKPLVTIALLTRNAGRDFAEVLEAIFSQKTTFSFEVLALDNESDDGTWQQLEKYRLIRKVSIPRQEFDHSRTRNRAMELARGMIVVFLVQDALPVGTDWLQKLVRPLLIQVNGKDVISKKIAGVSGRQVPPKTIPLPQRYFLLHSYTDEPRILTTLPTEFGPGRIWFSNVCSAIARWAWEQVPFPDVVMSEDQAWAREVLKRGWTLIYAPEAKVIHGHNLSWSWLFRRNVDSGASLAGMGYAVPTVGRGGSWKWLANELVFAHKEEGISGVGKTFLYEIVRFIGFQIGYRKWVPIAVKRYFSIVPWYYDRRVKS
jgi:rhamnosyltransferase